MKKKDKDTQNEYIGIVAIIVIVIVAVGILYYFFSHRHIVLANSPNDIVPLEAPAPINNNTSDIKTIE